MKRVSLPVRRQGQHWTQLDSDPQSPASCSALWTASSTPVHTEHGREEREREEREREMSNNAPKRVKWGSKIFDISRICLPIPLHSHTAALTSRMVQSARMALALYSSSFPVMSFVRLRGIKMMVKEFRVFL